MRFAYRGMLTCSFKCTFSGNFLDRDSEHNYTTVQTKERRSERGNGASEKLKMFSSQSDQREKDFERDSVQRVKDFPSIINNFPFTVISHKCYMHKLVHSNKHQEQQNKITARWWWWRQILFSFLIKKDKKEEQITARKCWNDSDLSYSQYLFSLLYMTNHHESCGDFISLWPLYGWRPWKPYTVWQTSLHKHLSTRQHFSVFSRNHRSEVVSLNSNYVTQTNNG